MGHQESQRVDEIIQALPFSQTFGVLSRSTMSFLEENAEYEVSMVFQVPTLS
jgi:hypothetical protein